jgi:erythronate-4-phosphate dehydrogenase
MKIVADEQIPFVREYFADCGELILKPGRAIVPETVQSADMLLVRTVTDVNESLLSGSDVKFVGTVTAGADHLDTTWLNENDISWHTAAGFNAPPVADYVACTVAALERITVLGGDRKRAAVIGVGNTGSLAVDRLRALNFEVICCDPLRAESEPDFISVPLAEIEEVDLISLHVPLTRDGAHPTWHFIDKAFLKRQKPGCVLLNASRGTVINEQDLLSDGKHLYWSFDVWAHEPVINKEVLQRAIIATPHIAGYSVQSKIRGVELIYEAACAAGLIEHKRREPVVMPRQQLNFAENTNHWRDVLLGIFNPMILTTMMRSIILPAEEYGAQFDEMRHTFNYRNEFQYVDVSGIEDAGTVDILHRLGIHTRVL